ncbi:MAG: RNA-binding cell elongation regulator Jag/EloR [bacterium]
MKEIEVEGKTVEEAIEIALKQLGVKKEEVEIDIVNEGKMGLFGLMGASPAKIKVCLKNKEAIPGQRPVEISPEHEKMVKDVVSELLRLTGVSAEVNISVAGGKLLAEINSPDGALLIGKRGQTLDALQFIVNLIINRQLSQKAQTDRLVVVLDTENYRHKREIALQNLAKNIADRVKQTGDKQEMEPMSPQDRRVIHLAIGDDPELDVNSEGEGIYRKIVVRRKR